MEILEIIPKDIHVIMAIPVREMELLKEAFDFVEFQGDGIDESEPVRFVMDKFYPFLVKTLEKVKINVSGPNES